MKQFRNSRFYASEDGELFKLLKNNKYKQLKGVIRKGGYIFFTLQCPSVAGNKGFLNIYLHQIIAECFLGPRPKNKEVDHIDGDKLNNSVDNLQYITHRQNVQKNPKGWQS